MNKLLLVLVFGSCFSVGAQIQSTRDVVATSGTEFSNANLEVSFTLGETFTELTAPFALDATWVPVNSHSLGFQQANFSYVSINELTYEVLTLFPNPANEQITFTSSSEAPFIYRVHDIAGRIVRVGRSIDGVLTLDVTNIEEGKYYLEYIPESGTAQYLPFIKIL